MTFEEWENYIFSSNGVDFDGYYGKQCVDLTNHFLVNVAGLVKGKTGASVAKDLINNSYLKSTCEMIKNYPEYVPPRGAIFVKRGYVNGHTGVCTGVGDTHSFEVIEQNYEGNTTGGSIRKARILYTDGGELWFIVPKIANTYKYKYRVGQKVRVSSYYRTSVDTADKAIYGNVTGKITKVLDYDYNDKGEKVLNRYLLASGNIGWCNEGDIREVIS